jgi:hypothetical protein
VTVADSVSQTAPLADATKVLCGGSALIDLPGEVIAALNARDIAGAISALQEAEGLEFEDAKLVIERCVR